MDTDIDLENELLQLLVEELVRAGLQTSLREPILAAVERTPDGPVEVVVPDEGDDAAGDAGADDEAGDAGSADVDATEDAEPEATGPGPVGKAARGLVVFVLLFTVLYVALSRLTGDDGA